MPNTPVLLCAVSLCHRFLLQVLRVPLSALSFGGIKDKTAITTQVQHIVEQFTIPSFRSPGGAFRFRCTRPESSVSFDRYPPGALVRVTNVETRKNNRTVLLVPWRVDVDSAVGGDGQTIYAAHIDTIRVSFQKNVQKYFNHVDVPACRCCFFCCWG